jgi:hypothetical protein
MEMHAMQANRTLTSLNLNGNLLDEAGSVAISDMLKALMLRCVMLRQ